MRMYCNVDIHTWEELDLFLILTDDILFDFVSPIPSSWVIYKVHWVLIIMCGMVINLECIAVTS